ncbi:MAG TPA: hypothetical protein VK586_26395, partial [Streptosporangiaceae bacterium]|nr:hypothetical protein [Streptosporangiaceae bacterium]
MLIEGLTNALEEMVWTSIETDYQDDGLRARLRLAVEGPEYAKLPALDWERVPHPASMRYPSHPDAMKLIAHAGWGAMLDALVNGRFEKIAGVFSQLFDPQPGQAPGQPDVQPEQPGVPARDAAEWSLPGQLTRVNPGQRPADGEWGDIYRLSPGEGLPELTVEVMKSGRFARSGGPVDDALRAAALGAPERDDGWILQHAPGTSPEQLDALRRALTPAYLGQLKEEAEVVARPLPDPGITVPLTPGITLQNTSDGAGLAAGRLAGIRPWQPGLTGLTLHVGAPGDVAAGRPVPTRRDVVGLLRSVRRKLQPAQVMLSFPVEDGQRWADTLQRPVLVPVAELTAAGRAVLRDESGAEVPAMVRGLTYAPARPGAAPRPPQVLYRAVFTWLDLETVRAGAGIRRLPGTAGGSDHFIQMTKTGPLLSKGRADDAALAAADAAQPPPGRWYLHLHPTADPAVTAAVKAAIRRDTLYLRMTERPMEAAATAPAVPSASGRPPATDAPAPAPAAAGTRGGGGLGLSRHVVLAPFDAGRHGAGAGYGRTAELEVGLRGGGDGSPPRSPGTVIPAADPDQLPGSGPAHGPPFSPARLSEDLHGVGAGDALTAGQIATVRALPGEPADILAGLGLEPQQLGQGLRWLADVRNAGARLDRLRAHLNGGAAAPLGAGELPDLVLALLRGPARGLVVPLLRTVTGAALADLFGDRRVYRVLRSLARTDGPLRADIDDFVRTHFQGGHGALRRGTVNPVTFTPERISTSLRGQNPHDRPEGDAVGRAAVALAGRSDDELLAGLPEPERAIGATWLSLARAAIGAQVGTWVDQVRGDRSGNPGYDLTAARKRQLVWQLLADPAGGRAALALLSASKPAELRRAFGKGRPYEVPDKLVPAAAAPALYGVLATVVPAADVPDLNWVLDGRFVGGRDAVAAGLVQPRPQPGGVFSAGLLSPRLDGIELGLPLAGQPAGLIAGTLSGFTAADYRRVGKALADLPLPERERAAWMLDKARTAVQASGGQPARAAAAGLERLLAPLRRDPRRIGTGARPGDIRLVRAPAGVRLDARTVPYGAGRLTPRDRAAQAILRVHQAQELREKRITRRTAAVAARQDSDKRRDLETLTAERAALQRRLDAGKAPASQSPAGLTARIRQADAAIARLTGSPGGGQGPASRQADQEQAQQRAALEWQENQQQLAGLHARRQELELVLAASPPRAESTALAAERLDVISRTRQELSRVRLEIIRRGGPGQTGISAAEKARRQEVAAEQASQLAADAHAALHEEVREIEASLADLPPVTESLSEHLRTVRGFGVLKAQLAAAQRSIGLLTTGHVPAWKARVLSEESSRRHDTRAALAGRDSLAVPGGGALRGGALESTRPAAAPDGNGALPADSSSLPVRRAPGAAGAPAGANGARRGPQSPRNGRQNGSRPGPYGNGFAPGGEGAGRPGEGEEQVSFQLRDGIFRLVRGTGSAESGGGAGSGSRADQRPRPPAPPGGHRASAGNGGLQLDRSGPDSTTVVLEPKDARTAAPEQAEATRTADAEAARAAQDEATATARDEAAAGRRLGESLLEPAERLQQLVLVQEALQNLDGALTRDATAAQALAPEEGR